MNRGDIFDLFAVFFIKEGESVDIELHKSPQKYDDNEMLNNLQKDLALIIPPKVLNRPVNF